MPFILRTLLELLKAVAYKWLLAFLHIFQQLIRLLLLWWRQRKLPHDATNATNTGCGPIDHPSFHRPDPLIYSQKYLLELGLAVTWDNPDIIVLRNGVPVPEWELLPNTLYEIDATIWNNSYEAPVVGMPVDFAFLSFGAGATLTPIGRTYVNVGVKGGANHPAHARMAWTTPPAGHYCIQVSFQWNGDLNPRNNLGQNNVDVVAAQSPAVTAFRLRNPFRRTERLQFLIDTYTLPDPPDCAPPPDRTPTVEQRWDAVKRRHDRAAFPVPPGWTIAFTPDHAVLPPGGELDVTVSLDPPAGFTGRQPFNVHAVASGGRCAGGVTLVVEKA